MFPLATARKPGAGSNRAGANGLVGRAPKLREAGERFVAAIVKSLQTMAGPATTVEGMLAGFSTDTAREVVAAHRSYTAAGSIALKEPRLSILVTLDATLVHGLVELFCGGRGIESPAVAPRPVTSIDQQFAHIVLTLAATAVQTEWAAHGFGEARVVRIDGPLTNDVFGTRTDEVGIVNITIGLFGLHGTLRLVLPDAAIERFVDAAHETTSSDGPDPLWASLLQDEIGRAPVALAAFLDAKEIPLSALAGLKIGQILALPTDARSRATLMSDGRVLYRGEVGQDDNRYSLRIDEIVSDPTSVARVAERRAPYLEPFKAS